MEEIIFENIYSVLYQLVWNFFIPRSKKGDKGKGVYISREEVPPIDVGYDI